MPHIYPELIFFILVSALPAVIFFQINQIHKVDAASLMIACGCVFLSVSWVADFGVHLYVTDNSVELQDLSLPHILLILFGLVPGVALVGIGIVSWLREFAALRLEIGRRQEAEQELERVNRQLEQQAARAEMADRVKDDFLANLSHDLRTPLNAIIGFSELMHAEMLGELGTARYKEYLDAINSSSRQLHDSISDMLDLAKINVGQMKLRRQKVALRHLVEECIALIRPEADGKSIALEATFAAEMVVSADKRMLFQVLLNLLSNAIKFTPANGKVSLLVLQQTDGRPVLIVRDNGYGMSSEDIDLAIAPFEHAESLLARSHEGFALQLALVNKFVELHDGQLMIDSKPDYGTCVTIKLPAVKRSDAIVSENVVSIA